jgi:hypothetical protein
LSFFTFCISTSILKFELLLEEVRKPIPMRNVCYKQDWEVCKKLSYIMLFFCFQPRGERWVIVSLLVIRVMWGNAMIVNLDYRPSIGSDSVGIRKDINVIVLKSIYVYIVWTGVDNIYERHDISLLVQYSLFKCLLGVSFYLMFMHPN